MRALDEARFAEAGERHRHELCVHSYRMLGFMAHAYDRSGFGEWRLVPTAVNRMPAAASYLRREGERVFTPFKLDVLRVGDGLIAEMTTFDAAPLPPLRPTRGAV